MGKRKTVNVQKVIEGGEEIKFVEGDEADLKNKKEKKTRR